MRACTRPYPAVMVSLGVRFLRVRYCLLLLGAALALAACMRLRLRRWTRCEACCVLPCPLQGHVLPPDVVAYFVLHPDRVACIVSIRYLLACLQLPVSERAATLFICSSSMFPLLLVPRPIDVDDDVDAPVPSKGVVVRTPR